MMNIQRFTDPATGKFIELNNAIDLLDSDNLVAVANTTAGIKFDCKNYPNDRLMFIFVNSHATVAKDAKIYKPSNGGYAASDTDLVLEDVTAAGGVAVAYVETAKYANTDGSIVVTGESTDIKAVAVVLGK